MFNSQNLKTIIMEISNFQSLLGFLLIVLLVLIPLNKEHRKNVTKSYKSLIPLYGIIKILAEWFKYKSKGRGKD